MSTLVLQRRTVGVESVFLAIHGGENLCPRLSISLPDAVTARQLRDMLAQYDVYLISGPDDDGRFVLSTPRNSSLYDTARVLDVASAARSSDTVYPRP